MGSASGSGEEATIRPANREDAPDIARLGDLAGDGLPSYFWRLTAAPGQPAFEVGVARARRDEADFSWRNTAVIEVGGRVAGALVTYPIPDEPEPLEELGPIVRTLQALENQALGSQYVNVLAVYDEFRRRGYGRRLLEEAERRAGARPLSLIVADRNAGARRLYEAFGFRVAAEVAMEKEGWQSDSTAWVLMLRPAQQAFSNADGRPRLGTGGF